MSAFGVLTVAFVADDRSLKGRLRPLLSVTQPWDVEGARGTALRSALSATPSGTALGSQQVVRSEFVAMPQRVGALPAPGAGAADLEGFLPVPLLDCVGSHAGE